MKPITPAQLKMIHTLLGKENLTERKADLCMSFSDGRTASSRELTKQEAKDFIEHLLNDEKRKEIVKAIWYLAYTMEIITGDSFADKKMNAAKLDLFCKERGTVKKSLSAQTLKELQRTRRQFEAMHTKHADRRSDLDYLKLCKEALQLCIDREDYERAAIMRDEINSLNEKLKPKRTRRVTAV